MFNGQQNGMNNQTLHLPHQQTHNLVNQSNLLNSMYQRQQTQSLLYPYNNTFNYIEDNFNNHRQLTNDASTQQSSQILSPQILPQHTSQTLRILQPPPGLENENRNHSQPNEQNTSLVTHEANNRNNNGHHYYHRTFRNPISSIEIMTGTLNDVFNGINNNALTFTHNDMNNREISAREFLNATKFVPYYYIHSREEEEEEEEEEKNEEGNENEEKNEEGNEEGNDNRIFIDNDQAYSEEYISANLHLTHQIPKILNDQCFCGTEFQPHSVVCVLPCNHGFHYRCISNWFFCDHARSNGFQNRCPVCRNILL